MQSALYMAYEMTIDIPFFTRYALRAHSRATRSKARLVSKSMANSACQAREKLLQTIKLRYLMRKATMTWRSNIHYSMF